MIYRMFFFIQYDIKFYGDEIRYIIKIPKKNMKDYANRRYTPRN